MPEKTKARGFWWLLAPLSALVTVVAYVIPDSGDWLREDAVPWLGNHPKLLSIIFLTLGLIIAYLAFQWRAERDWAIRLRDEATRRPTVEAHNESLERIAELEEQLSKLNRRSHKDDQMYLNRMIRDRRTWSWLESFDGRRWTYRRMTGLRDYYHECKELRFRDSEFETSRKHFLESINKFVTRATNERDDEYYPIIDPEGVELDNDWEGRIKGPSERKGGLAEYEQTKAALDDLGAQVSSSWRTLLNLARSRPDLSVDIEKEPW